MANWDLDVFIMSTNTENTFNVLHIGQQLLGTRLVLAVRELEPKAETDE